MMHKLRKSEKEWHNLRVGFYDAALALLLFASPANALFAQTAPFENTPSRLTVFAHTVVEDVVVTDKDGRAVPGLSKQDFQLFENGKLQDITFFESNFDHKETAASPPAALPSNTFTNVPIAPPNNVTNVLLLDALNTRSTERMYAQVQMVKYLATLPPNMRIAVFTLDNEKFHMIWGFNQDASVLRTAILKSFAKRSHLAAASPVGQPETERQRLIDSVNAVMQSAKESGDNRLGESADALQHFLDHGPGIIYEYGNFFTSMIALESMAHYLAGIPGRKNLFWVAGSFPHQFKSDGYFDWYRRARDELTKAEVSVYPIDANGVDVDTGGAPNTRGMTASTTRFVASEAWAEETGGRAYQENDIPQEIADAAEHGSRYYTMAYVPSDEKEDNRERRIEIKVTSGGYKLFYRKSYFEHPSSEVAKSLSAPVKDPLVRLMGRGLPNIGEIPYRLKVVPTATRPSSATPRAGENAQLNGRLSQYNISLHLLPGGLFSLLPDGDGARRERLDVMIVVYSQDGKPLNWKSQTENLMIRPEQWVRARAQGISFQFVVDAPIGDVYLRTGVYDSSANKVGTLEIPLSAVTQTREE